MKIVISQHGAVTCAAQVNLPLSATAAWGQLRDFARYAQQDFFHADIEIEGDIPRSGAAIRLTHRYAGLSVCRHGRILTWREGVGYSFSDLSFRGPRAGFPHVFRYHLEQRGESACQLQITVRGLWTAQWIPRWAARLWLLWVFGHVLRIVRANLLVFQLWTRSKNIYCR